MNTCETCRHYLGGGQCAVSLEQECKDGNYEAWEKNVGGIHDDQHISSAGCGAHRPPC